MSSKPGRGLPTGGLLPIDEARRRIADAVDPVEGTESVALADCLGRVLAEDLVSPINVPGHTNSALDGFAFAGSEIPCEGVNELSVIGTAWAGKPLGKHISPGQAARIMTGAPMPPGTDTVVAQELVSWNSERVSIDAGHERGKNVRQAGEDLAAGEVAIAAGKRLMPAEMGLIASLGIETITAVRRIKVAFFSTGDELSRPGEPVSDGGVYDSNGYTLRGLLTRMGVAVEDKGIIRDQRALVEDALLSASRSADVIITSGGVSTGEADYVEEVLRRHGELGFWRVAIRPGRPLAFGRLGRSVFFGLPGNPVAVMVTFHQFLQTALAKMMGQSDIEPTPTFKVRCVSALRKKRGRTEFYRAVLSHAVDGELVVDKTRRQGSGVLHSMSEANCFVVLPDDCESTEAGALVDVQPFFGLI